MITCSRLNCDACGDIMMAVPLQSECLHIARMYDASTPGCGLCSLHATECQILFPKSSPTASFDWEYCTSTGTIDYLSKNNKSNRNVDRILTIKPTDSNYQFLIASALLRGREVPNRYFSDIIEKMNSPSMEISSVEFGNAYTTPVSSGISTYHSTEPSLSSGGSTSSEDLDSTIGFVDAHCISMIREEFFVRTSVVTPPSVSPRTTVLTSDSPAEDRRGVEFPPLLVSIEGNIGAGKSTLLKKLRAAHEDWIFIDEPLDTWTSLKNEEDVNLLELFYGNQHRWSYTFQNCALLSRYQNIENAITSSSKSGTRMSSRPVFVTERCLETDHEVFAKMLHGDKLIDSLEYDLYVKWFTLLQKSATPLSAIIHVNTEPSTCVDRIKGRAREGEEGIPLAYLQSLDCYQADWLDNTGVPCLRVTSDAVDAVGEFITALLCSGEAV